MLRIVPCTVCDTIADDMIVVGCEEMWRPRAQVTPCTEIAAMATASLRTRERSRKQETKLKKRVRNRQRPARSGYLSSIRLVSDPGANVSRRHLVRPCIRSLPLSFAYQDWNSAKVFRMACDSMTRFNNCTSSSKCWRHSGEKDWAGPFLCFPLRCTFSSITSRKLTTKKIMYHLSELYESGI